MVPKKEPITKRVCEPRRRDYLQKHYVIMTTSDRATRTNAQAGFRPAFASSGQRAAPLVRTAGRLCGQAQRFFFAPVLGCLGPAVRNLDRTPGTVLPSEVPIFRHSDVWSAPPKSPFAASLQGLTSLLSASFVLDSCVLFGLIPNTLISSYISPVRSSGLSFSVSFRSAAAPRYVRFIRVHAEARH